MSRLIRLFSVAAAFMVSGSVMAADEPIELLFIQNAQEVAFGPKTMTLKGVSPSVIFFSDRPNRVAGHVVLSGFLQAWEEGADSFAEDPPNAGVSIVDEGKITDVIVTLSNPRHEGNDLTYDVQVIEGEAPQSGGVTALFIDGLFSGGALQSGGRGAALGAIGGAIGGDAGKGAAIGAAVGALGGAMEERSGGN